MDSKNIKEVLTTSDVKTKAIKSIKWTALAEVLSRSIQPIVTLILARLLSPSDFGIVGIAMIAIGLAQILQDFGLGKTLIQRENKIEASANVVFWMNIALGIILYIVIFTASPLISKFFHEPKTINVLRVLCLQIVIASFFVVHSALLQRSLQFKPIFMARFGASLAPGIVSIPMALAGMGIWALVCGTLAGSLVQFILFWKLSPWRPKWNFDIPLAKELLGFSSWVVLEAFLGWLIIWGDSIVLGHFLGVKELGVYRVGVTFLMLVFGIFFNPLIPVAYSAFSRLQSNPEELKQSLLKITRLMASVSLPIGIGLAILAKPISSLVFGQKWEGIGIVIAIIGITYAISWLVGINPEVYRAIGRPDINSKLHIAAVIYYIPVYILAAPYGLFIFCLARLAVAIVAMGLVLFVAKRVLNLPFFYLSSCIKAPLIGGSVMAVIIYLVLNFIGVFEGLAGWVKMFGIIAAGGITYTFVLWLIDKNILRQFWRFARRL